MRLVSYNLVVRLDSADTGDGLSGCGRPDRCSIGIVHCSIQDRKNRGLYVVLDKEVDGQILDVNSAVGLDVCIRIHEAIPEAIKGSLFAFSSRVEYLLKIDEGIAGRDSVLY